ncbi:hypothetical protein CONLIGDRAFT_631174 [Coniochaeta ligniaria NRRL 30616]|uniref:Protein kinase domain-containing protein n=1 Tax=Coniochaeta ligniaria NRRL 30616 TaxID=1408157 RepID=A0A1J7IVP7_9PEZI|nr:hypothetical protein CONLIGDRAFT_631174 [Coniochaeta ligniaria NRRL 30616]
MHFQKDPVSKLAASHACSRIDLVRGYENPVETVYDTESRRWLKVVCHRLGGDYLETDHVCNQLFFQKAAPMFAAIRAELDAGPPNLTALTVDLDGQVLTRSTNPDDDITPGTHYASVGDYQIPAHVKTLARDELVELARLVPFGDIVILASSPSLDAERLVFKYYQHVFDLQATWNAIHIGAKLSSHPHIAPVRHLVVDETDRSRVVGFTTPFYPGGDLSETAQSRPFKLKWAKQLLGTLDDLHLKYGVFHGDIKLRNMVIDPSTDNLTLIDFGVSAKIGTPDYELHHMAALKPEAFNRSHRGYAEDAILAIRAVYGAVRGSEDLGFFGGTDPSGFPIPIQTSDITKGGWVKGENVTLDSPVEDYYRLVKDWLHERNNGRKVTQHNQASEPLNYPDFMPPPQADIDAYRDMLARRPEATLYGELTSPQPLNLDLSRPRELIPDDELLEEMRFPGIMFWQFWWQSVWTGRPTSGRYFRRIDAVEAGRPFLNWERPPAAQLDPTRRLLANGKYEDEHNSTSTKTNERKRKAREEEEEEEARDGSDDSGGKASEISTASNATMRVTRSATKKANGAVAPPAPKPKPAAARKAAAIKGKGRKAARATANGKKKTPDQGLPNGK